MFLCDSEKLPAGLSKLRSTFPDKSSGKKIEKEKINFNRRFYEL